MLAKVAELGSSVLKHAGGIQAVAVTPDGKRILSIGDGTDIHVWDAATGESAGDLAGGDRGMYALAVSADGRRVLAGGHAVQLFELATKRLVATPVVRKPLVVAAAFGPDGSFVFGDDRTPRRFDAQGRELAPLVAHRGRIEALAISRDGALALTCASDSTMKLQANTAAPKVLATWQAHARSCGFSPDGTLVWSVGYFAAIVRGRETGRVMFEEALEQMRTGALSPDGSRFAIATESAVHVYRLPGKRRIAKLELYAKTLAFLPDGKRLVAGNDGQRAGESFGIGVFDVDAERRVLPSDTGHTGPIEGLAIAASTPHVLYSIGADGLVVMWDLDLGEPIERIGRVAGQGRAIACTPDGATLVTASTEDGLVAWDVRRTDKSRLPADGASGLAVAVAGDRIAYLSYSPRNLQVFELATRARIAATPTSRSHVAGAVAIVAPDLVVASGADGSAVATRLPAGKRAWVVQPAGFVTAICATSTAVVVGSTDGAIGAYDPATGAHLAILRDGGTEVHHACALDGDHVAVLCRAEDFETSVLEVWSVPARHRIARAELGVAARSLAAAPDGRRIYVGTRTSRVLVFEIVSDGG